MNKLPLLAALTLIPTTAFAQSGDPIVTAPDSGGVSLAIAQADAAGSTLVVDSRPVTLPAGRARLRIGNLAASRVESSLQIGLPAGRILQQSNLVPDDGPFSLLTKSIGQRVTVRVPQQPPLSGTLRQAAPYITIENAEGTHVLDASATSYITLERLPADAAPRPATEALVEGPGGTGPAEIRYLTSGLSWTANYGATLIGERLSLKSWVNVTNNSTANFRNAQLALGYAPNDGRAAYDFPTRVDLPAGQTRSFVLADMDNTAFTSDIVWITQSFEAAETSGKPRLTLNLKQPAPTELPRGALTVYGVSPTGAAQIISTEGIGPFAKGDGIRIALGEAPFVSLKREVTQKRLNPKTREFTITFNLYSTAPAPVTVRIIETIGDASKVTTSSLPPAKSENGNLQFLVTVPSKDNANFSYTVERPN